MMWLLAISAVGVLGLTIWGIHHLSKEMEGY